MQQEPIHPARLLQRLQHYAAAAGASPSSTRAMLELLQSPLGASILQLSAGPELCSYLVNNLYKVHMQAMYAQFMTGVTADFALNIRKCPRLGGGSSSSSSSIDKSGSNNVAKQGSSSSSSINPAAYVLADIREQHPAIFSELVARTTQQLQGIEQLSEAVLATLREFNDYTPPQVLLDRLAAAGVADVEWVDIEGAPVAVGSGPIEAASNTETSVMQAVQAAIIAAAAAAAAAHQNSAGPLPLTSSNNSSSSDTLTSPHLPAEQQQLPVTPTATVPAPSLPDPTAAAAAGTNPESISSGSSISSSGGVCLDRTERLASSLGRMVATVEGLNDIPHSFGIMLMLMAGRRSTDLLHLVLQNLPLLWTNTHPDARVQPQGSCNSVPAWAARGIHQGSCMGWARRKAVLT